MKDQVYLKSTSKSTNPGSSLKKDSSLKNCYNDNAYTGFKHPPPGSRSIESTISSIENIADRMNGQVGGQTAG